ASELLIGLYALTIAEPRPSEETWVPQLAACSAPLRRAVAALGEETGELWLHLLGLALELPAASAAAWTRQLADVDPAELRRHLVGVHVPAWRAAVGADALERAAAGDAHAAAGLVPDDAYVGGP